jgi:hypothetical protein
MRWALVILAALLLVGCNKGCSDRPAAPVVPPAPGAPAADASPADREAYWRKQVAEARAQLATAQEDARAAEDRAWRVWTRWIGLAGFALAAAAAGVLSWLVSPKVGLPVGAIVAGVAAAVVTYGETVRWLPLALGGSAVLVGVVWTLYHLRHLHVADKASRAIDALEHGTESTAQAAKLILGEAVDRAALRPRMNRIRGKV